MEGFHSTPIAFPVTTQTSGSDPGAACYQWHILQKLRSHRKPGFNGFWYHKVKKKCRGWIIGKAVSAICSAVYSLYRWFQCQLSGAGAQEPRGNRENGTNTKCVWIALTYIEDQKRRRNKIDEKNPHYFNITNSFYKIGDKIACIHRGIFISLYFKNY